MFDWLRQFPDLVVIALAAAVSMGLVALTGLLPPRNGTALPSAGSNSALEAFKVIVSFTAILLSFLLVQAVGALRSTETNVSREAGALNTLDRVLTRYHTPATDAIRPVFRVIRFSRLLRRSGLRFGVRRSVRSPRRVCVLTA